MKKLFILINFIGMFLVTKSAHALTIYNPSNLFVDNLNGNSFGGIITFIIQNILLPIVGLISLLFIILGGFQYMTARGDEERAEAGKKTLTNAIIGLVIVILSFTIVTVVINALKGSV
jgi:glucose uptake protein GlcU